jgi:hypothetical protein
MKKTFLQKTKNGFDKLKVAFKSFGSKIKATPHKAQLFGIEI